MKRPLSLDTRAVPLPRGTRVVLTADLPARDGWICRAGSVARVEEVEHPDYVLSTPSGHTVDARRSQVTVQHARLADVAGARAWAWAELEAHLVLDVVVGSTAWGLADDTSDEDRRGAFLLPFSLRAGLFEPPDELAPAGEERQYWEVEKVIRQGLRGDANTLEMLWSPLVVHETTEGRLLREHRHLFLSQRVHRSFGRYAISQFEKLRRKVEQHETEATVVRALQGAPGLPEPELLTRLVDEGLGDRETAAERLRRVAHAFHDRGLIPTRRIDDLRAHLETHGFDRAPYRPKNAYNLLRLLHSGERLLRTGTPMIRVEDPALRARLLEIKAGRADLDGVIAEAHQLAARLDEALTHTVLPEEPDVAGADALLTRLRTRAARRHFALPVVDRPDARPVTLPAPGVPLDVAPCRAWLRATADRDVVVVSVTGAHAYGFPSPDSDVDLKGIHLEPASAVLGLDGPRGAVDRVERVDGVELDLTLQEAAEALRLLVKGNGNMLERLLSPWEVLPGPDAPAAAHERLTWLRELAVAGLHRGAFHHYRGFFVRARADAARAPTVKGWLYAYRVALTGVHLLRHGAVVQDLQVLLDAYALPHVRDLIAAKRTGAERADVSSLPPSLAATVARDLASLEALLVDAAERSPLPPTCPNRPDLDDWLRHWRATPIVSL